MTHMHYRTSVERLCDCVIDSLLDCRRKQTNFLQGASDLTALEPPLSKQAQDTTTIHQATATQLPESLYLSGFFLSKRVLIQATV